MNKKHVIIAAIAFLVLLLAVALTISMCRNKECTHVDGNGDYLCDSCGKSMIKTDPNSNLPETDPVTGCVHRWLPATCTSDGFCAGCGMDGDKAKGHTPGELEVCLSPLCGIEGLYIRPCTECGDVIEEVDIPALEHNWVDGVCTICGDTQP